MADQKTLPCPFCCSAAEVKSAVVDGKEYSNVSCSKTACPGFNNISHQRTTKISVKLWNARTAGARGRQQHSNQHRRKKYRFDAFSGKAFKVGDEKWSLLHPHPRKHNQAGRRH